MTLRFASRLLLASLLAWSALIVAPPVILLFGGAEIAGPLRHAFHAVCAQTPGHSILLNGEPLLVCARCTAIYLTFTVTALVIVLVPSSMGRLIDLTQDNGRLVLIFSALPMCADVALGWIGLHDCTMVSRLFTGAVFGAGSALVLFPQAASWMARRFAQVNSDYVSQTA